MTYASDPNGNPVLSGWLLLDEDERVALIADILPYHWRTNPPGGMCSCGYETPLGRKTSEHVARLIVQAITRA